MTEITALAKNIKLIIFDVDGVLTNGQLLYIDGCEYKAFDSKDGLGIGLLLKAGIEVAIISGNESAAVDVRFKKFNLKHLYQGVLNKQDKYDEIKYDLGISDSEIAYMGDDLIDLPVMTQVGLPVAVANADDFVKSHSKWISQAKGGQGAVREFIDLVLMAQGKLVTLRESFLIR